jgi:hypothetical protein
MRPRILVLCWLVLVSGCEKEPKEASSVEAADEPVTANGVAEPMPAAPEESTRPEEADMTAVLGQLTQVVRKYAVEQRRAPGSLDELVSAGYLSQLPEAPAGHGFRIDKKLQVELVRR